MTFPDHRASAVRPVASSADPVEPVEPPVEPTVPVEPVEPPTEPADPAEPFVDAAPTLAAEPAPAGRFPIPVVALTLMAVLMAVATGFLWFQVHQHNQVDAARKDGLAASRDAARLLFSYDYRTLDKDFGTGRGLTTGAFRKEYDTTTTKVVSDVARQYKAVVQANVVQAGVASATQDTVVTIVYVNQVTTSTRVTGQKVDVSRVRMTLNRVDARWLVAKVEAL